MGASDAAAQFPLASDALCALREVSLEDKYTRHSGRIYLSGVQALVRLPLIQRWRDEAAGLHTAGFVSGYRGSPLGGLDESLWKAKPHFDANHIKFQPGINEDLAATAVWGSQQVGLIGPSPYDGVFSMWYGKGPGVDRCGDVFKHANHFGTSRHGGVLLVAGDDHGAFSSSLPHQSDHLFAASMIPLLYPCNVQEYVDLGLHGWAMSRYSGCWVAMKITSDSAESSATVDVDPQRVRIALPEDFAMPPGGLHIRWPDPPLAQERRMQEFKVYAALAYARSNRLNHLVFGSRQPARLGIIACGKAYLDVRQALDDLGIDERQAADIGLRLYKVGMPWPLEADGVRHFAEGLEEILVVEEKRQIIEYQLKEQLYNWREDVRPRVVGKFDERGEWSASQGPWLLPPTGELTPAIVARAIAARIGRFHSSEKIRQRLAFLEAKDLSLAQSPVAAPRAPHFCSGCPHNLSTKVPQGSAALGGVGCHLMAVNMDRNTLTISQMGGEGAAWLGIAEHSGTRHIFANLGDGTYYHSGLLAIRAAVAAGVNITYKILYNDAVAMTGGQALDGPLDVPQISRQLAAEGLQRIVVLADDVDKYPLGHTYHGHAGFAPQVQILPREELDRVQRELRDTPGVSALIYDQTCAAEKRRRRKRGEFPDPARRIFINQLVCEGCGDCGVKSNCLSVVPVETEFGRKRAIDQSSCNKDYSCASGFCPSFVTVSGGRVRRGKALAGAGEDLAGLPEPLLPDLAAPFGILVAGVGGTGVVTIGALIGMAAHIEGKGVTVLDMTGLAQKGGAVFSHVRLAERQDQLHAARIATGEANTILGCDILVAVSADSLAKTQSGLSRAIVNTGRAITGDFVRRPDQVFPLEAMQDQLRAAVGPDAAEFLDGTRLATLLLGNSIMTNMFLLGYAWQRGQIPVSAAALMQAVELNGVAIAENTRAFAWGRRAAHDPAGIEAMVRAAEPLLPTHRISQSLDEIVARRRDYLSGYQDAAYAKRYTGLVARVRAAEAVATPGATGLSEAVARNYFKLLAYKDEYEVARLFSDPEFEAALRHAFEGDYRLSFHLAPPFLDSPDPISGEPRKRRFGPSLMPVLRVLAKLKFLRGTPLDVFGKTAERQLERQLIRQYEQDIASLLDGLDPANHAAILEIACLPEMIRGFGPIKLRSVEACRARRLALLDSVQTPAAIAMAA